MNERIAAESSKSDDSIDGEMRIIQEENAINPWIVEGKRVFGFDIGDVLRIEYICDEPPLGCAWAAWMKEQGSASIQLIQEQVHRSHCQASKSD